MKMFDGSPCNSDVSFNGWTATMRSRRWRRYGKDVALGDVESRCRYYRYTPQPRGRTLRRAMCDRGSGVCLFFSCSSIPPSRSTGFGAGSVSPPRRIGATNRLSPLDDAAIAAAWTVRDPSRARHSGLDIRPVLTAHPTESTRRTLLALQARVAELLLTRERTPTAERGPVEDALAGEIELLYLTAEVRHDRPSVLDEVSTVLWYLETRLLDASEQAHGTLVRAFEDNLASKLRGGHRLRWPCRYVLATGSVVTVTEIRSLRHYVGRGTAQHELCHF